MSVSTAYPVSIEGTGGRGPGGGIDQGGLIPYGAIMPAGKSLMGSLQKKPKSTLLNRGGRVPTEKATSTLLNRDREIY